MGIEVKISELIPGTLPLTGTEEVAVVQDGLTVRVPTSSITGGVPDAGQVHLYVSTANGSDANDGLTPATALATLPAAVALIRGRRLVTIHLATGAHPITADGLGNQFPGQLCLVGDGAGQPGDTGSTVLLTDAVSSSANGYTITPALGGMSVDTYRGKTLRWTSGDNAGRRVSVKSNDADDIVLVYPAVDAIQVSDAFVIEGPAVSITNPTGEVVTLVNGCGSPEGYRTPGHPTNRALWLANLRINADVDVAIAGARVHAWGVETAGALVLENASVRAGTARGYDKNDTASTAAPEWTTLMTSLLGTYAPTSADDWHGWGLHSAGASVLSGGHGGQTIVGYLVGTSLVAGGWHSLAGGRLADLTSLHGVTEIRSDTSALVIDAGAGIVAEGAVDVYGPMTVDGTADALTAYSGGRVRLADPTTTTLGGVGFGATAYNGGSIVFDGGLPAFTATAGDLTTDGGTPLVAATVLPNDGSVVFGPGASGPGHIFRR